MAIVYANSAGNWTDETIWYSEGQPYGQVPQNGDTVYANGFSVVFNVPSLKLIGGTIRNDECPYTNISGGTFTHTANLNIQVNLVGGTTHLFQCANLSLRIVVGNVTTSLSSGVGIFADTGTGNDNAYSITGDVIINNGNILVTHVHRNPKSQTINGNVTINGSGHGCNTDSIGLITINGNIIQNSNGNFNAGGGSYPVSINGDIIGGGNVVISNTASSINFLGNIVGTGKIFNSAGTIIIHNGSIIDITNNLMTSATTFSNEGYINSDAKIVSGNITTFNNNGTINTSSPLATNLTTLNLNGTINTSNDAIADFPIVTTNIQEGSHITYTQQQPLGWGELNAPADFEFEYNGSGVSTGAYIIVNKNEFQHSYPPENYVVSGTTYGDSNQFTGTMTQPDESVVLKDYVYDGGTKTGTLDTSSLDVPEDLYTQFSNITNKLSALQTRLSIADIIEALNQYTAVKVSDLASISIDTQDIEDALDDYGVATSSDLANVSTLTTTDLSNSLTMYGAAKPTDITNRLNSYGVSTLTQNQVESSVQSKLNSYGAAKPSDVSNALSNYNVSTLTTQDVGNQLASYNVSTVNYNDVKNATEEALNEEHITKEDYIASIIGDVVIINNDNNNNNQDER